MNKPLLVKPAVVAVLAIVLMLPMNMIRDLVAERQARRAEAVAGIAEGWGKRQTVANPYVAVSYERHWTEVRRDTVDGKPREQSIERTESRTLRFPVAAIDWSASADITERARGIYRARLYSAKLDARGSMTLPARAGFEDGTSRYKWGTPRFVIPVSDPLGIRAAADISLGGRAYRLAPGGEGVPGVHATLPEGVLARDREQVLEFSLGLELGGSEAFSLAPVGSDTTLSLRADWPHPSFQGRFLPARHDITAAGFTAAWKVSRLAGQSGAKADELIAVSFVEPASLYHRLERAAKYGFLFIGLTFAAFMLLELLRRLAIHPVQYGLVGLALAMFFLLLTALSEHIAFLAAYGIASVACVGLVTAYVLYVLRSGALAVAFGAALSALYGILYVLLQAEDHALLGGSLLLFTLLAALMLATRRVDWYLLTAKGESLR